MAKLIGIDDKEAVKVICPKCGKVLMYVGKDASGKIYPFCKLCKKNVAVLPPYSDIPFNSPL